jgi:23S rRNA (cytidine1920-2'-O)/16S rRNA (cytidine1409-2'-O)-methyltransferase
MTEKKSTEQPNTPDAGKARSTEQNIETEKTRLTRLDQLLVQLGYAQSRERAKALIKAGHVLVDGKPIIKVSTQCALDAKIEVTAKDIPWVSRAGLKLEKALDTWPINVADAVCLDVGASTGGFTEVLLHRGAKQVYALDVGHGQLAQRLRDDPRVVVMEDKNIRAATSEWFTEPLDIITVDVSFISLKHVLPKVTELLRDRGEVVVLIKPQFEVGKARIQKGVVRDPVLHKQVIDTIKTLAIKEGLTPVDVTESPIEGVAGNKEFLLYLKKLAQRTD